MKNKVVQSVFLLLLFLLLALGVCYWIYYINLYPRGEIEHLKPLPDADIIFQVTTITEDDPPHYSSSYTFGFVNADGSGKEYFTIPKKERWRITDFIFGRLFEPIYPIISSDGSTIVFLLTPDPGTGHYLIVYQVGKESNICDLNASSTRSSFSHQDSKIIFDSNLLELQIGLFDISACKTGMEISEMKIVDIPLNSYMFDGSLSPNGSYLAYTQSIKDEDQFSIIVNKLSTDEKITVGKGLGPRWSPNGNQLAYVGYDGLYVVDSDGTNSIKVINPESGGKDPSYREWPPFPSWSPDGEWLVYHKCILEVAMETRCREIGDYSIFKVNVETGEEYKIMDGGLNPYWRMQEDDR